MATLIDASVLIAVERGSFDLSARLAGHADEDVAVAAITASELLHGVHRAATTAQRNRREAFVEQLLANVPVIPFDLLAAGVHARLGARLAARGAAIGAHDLLIAATAIAAGCTLATCDKRSFPRIPGLSLEVW
ncbi:MAG TPA: PIN domain-containing protein [Bryobacterales bacterium]|nr:PIN domain-containing protein [Bryobacterales bacterium]